MRDEIRQMKAWIEQNRTLTTPLDIVVEGTTPGNDPAAAGAVVRPYAEAGATWWLEAHWEAGDDWKRVLERIRQGPPALESSC